MIHENLTTMTDSIIMCAHQIVGTNFSCIVTLKNTNCFNIINLDSMEQFELPKNEKKLNEPKF